MKSIIMSLVFVSSVVQANIEIGAIAAAGNGCKNGEVNLGDQNGRLQIMLDNLVAETGVKKRLDRKTCQLAIPIQVPAGYQIVVKLPEIKTFVGLHKKARARFNSEVFFAGGIGPKFQSQVRGPDFRHIILNQELVKETLVSRCGESAIIRLNLAAIVDSSSSKQAIAVIDAIDMTDLIGVRACR